MRASVRVAALALAVLLLARPRPVSCAPLEPSIRTELDLTVTYRYRSSDQYVETQAVKSGIDLQRGYFDEPAMARASVELGADLGLSAAIEAQLKREFGREYDDPGCFAATNLPIQGGSGNPFAVENAALMRGVVSWKSPSLDLVFGRDKVDYGKELQGSLYPSLRLPYLDALRARGRIGGFGIDWMVSTLHLVESFDGEDVDPNWTVPYEYHPGTDDTDPATAYGFENGAEPSVALELLHRLSWDFGKVRVGIAENCILVRRNNRFLVTDFLPMVSWHQTSIVPNNTTTIADVAWDPLPGLTLAAQGGLDDFNAESVGVADVSGVPTIGAFVLGAKYETEGTSGRLDAYAEAGYTHYLWGNFSAVGQISHETDVVPLARAQYRFLLDHGAALLPLTSPYGPGALWLRLEGGWRIGDSGPKVGAELLLLAKNAEANLISTLYEKGAADGRTVLFGSLGLPVSWRVGAFELSAEPEVLVRDGTWWAEASFAVAYRLRGSRALD